MKLAGHTRPAYFLYHSLWCGLDWLFPPTCAGCNTAGARWCEPCQQNVIRIPSPVCPCCGEPQTSPSLCHDCLTNPPEYQAVRSYGLFNGVLREALHRLKYKGDMGIGESLSKHLIELYNDLTWDIQIVVPVPLSPRRTRERGYNQSGLLGRPFAYGIQKTYSPFALARTKETRTQVGLSARERRHNVTGAFKANPNIVKGKVILVVDDVTTTGSTISACAQALTQAGASAVFGLTLARAVLQAGADGQPTSY